MALDGEQLCFSSFLYEKKIMFLDNLYTNLYSPVLEGGGGLEIKPEFALS